jgi:polysaccharide export outer membrane protein
LSRWALQEKITRELTERDLLKDMVVTVEFMNFKVSVLGEVKKPGTYSIEGDKVTVLEAIAMAGDLTVYGIRDEVYVIREENGERQNFKLDLRSKDIFNSPAYYLRQNDIIYVKPNEVRAGQSTINQNSVRSISLWLSITSLLTSISILVVNLVKK